MKLVTVNEMKQIEQEADSSGLTFLTMMEKAGDGLATEIQLLAFQENDEREVLGLVGSGNNGGDTLLALAHLSANGWIARAYLVGRNPQGDSQVERLKNAGGEIILAEKDTQFDHLSAFISTADVVIDGIIGTGVHLPLNNLVSNILQSVNHSIAEMPNPPFVFAVDCPSGIDCDSGEVAEDVIPASVTICMGAVKQGLLKFPAFELVGDLRVVDIGISEEINSFRNINHFVADADMVEDILPSRQSDSHKGTFGTAIIVAGSINYVGAPLLAGKAAYRIGTGLVQLAVPASVQLAIAGSLPEATWIILSQEIGVISDNSSHILLKNIHRATAILIGPGMGTEETTKRFMEGVLNGKILSKNSGSIGFSKRDEEKKSEETVRIPPFVVDADGLRLLERIDGWSKLLPADSILTPHPGEMAVLTGLEKEVIQADRLNIAKKYASDWGHVVVLKGAITVIAAPDGRATLIPVATSALAHAGTGDVLAGIIVGLRAQGISAYDSAVGGAWIHAQAGLYANEQIGNESSVMAGDVLDAVPDVLSIF